MPRVSPPRRALPWAFASLSLFAAPVARAATGVSVDVSRVELSAQPGSTVNHAVTVLHPGAANSGPMVVGAALRDFRFPESGEVQFLPAGTARNSLQRWLQVSPQSFQLTPGQRQQVRYTLQVPADAEPGLYWGVLFFSSNSPEQAAQAQPGNILGVTYTIDVGQIIYLQVGTPRLDAKLVGVQAAYDGGRIAVQATVRNAGTGLVRAAGRAQVVDSAGKAVGFLPIEESVVLPGYSRRFGGGGDLKLAPGQYQVLVALQYAKGKFFTAQTPLVVKAP
ncbi:hypothetical protein F8S09_07015 [Deinococcus sp. SDU3-2]|uniref:P pilus assembly protein, chaperone PapD n=1 Tax=Deinococcus terrestris TaxID=2651870 RepID=A0A7X1TRI3_9DEIO|nr:hypothetical protein [Deinococcus terrestris]MPY66446.1 hypothetical protein [Deinococcus terrestris]